MYGKKLDDISLKAKALLSGIVICCWLLASLLLKCKIVLVFVLLFNKESWSFRFTLRIHRFTHFYWFISLARSRVKKMKQNNRETKRHTHFSSSLDQQASFRETLEFYLNLKVSKWTRQTFFMNIIIFFKFLSKQKVIN